MHYKLCVVILIATVVSGLDTESLSRKNNFTYSYLHNLTHAELQSVFDHLFNWNISETDPKIQSIHSLAQVEIESLFNNLFKHNISIKDPESSVPFSVSENIDKSSESIPSSIEALVQNTESTLNEPTISTESTTPSNEATITGESGSTTDHFVWWVPPETPWWIPETQEPIQTESLSLETSTVAWPPSIPTAPWWTPNMTEGTVAEVSWWTPDTSTDDPLWTDNSWWETSSEPSVSTGFTPELTTNAWPPTVGTAPWWTPNLTESTESSINPNTGATEQWPPTVGTAPWWTPNLTEGTPDTTEAYKPTTEVSWWIPSFTISCSEETESSVAPQTESSVDLPTESSVAPQTESSVSPQTESSVDSQTESSVALPTESSVAPQTESSVDLPTDSSVAPQTESSVAPQTESSVDLPTESSVVPQTESSVSPQTESSVDSQTESSVALPTESSVAPQTESSVDLPTDSSVAPQTESSVAPQTESSVDLPTESSVAPQTESSFSPQTESSVDSLTESSVALPTDSSVAPQTESSDALPTESSVALPTESSVALPTESSVDLSTESSVSPQTEPSVSSGATEQWPPTVGTAPWWTPNLTESMSETTETYKPTHSTEIITTTQTPLLVAIVNNSVAAAPSGSTAYNPLDPTNVIGYDFPCGVRHKPTDGKIVGGYSTSLGEVPWQVSLQVFTGYGYGTRHICGGSIISKYFVVTAGHCVFGSNSNTFTVVAGDHNLFDIEGHEQRRRVERIYTNNYDKKIYKNDIALLELTRPLKFNNFVSPICLPNPGLTVTANVGLITGWGRLSEGGLLPHILQAAEVPLTPKEECRRSYAVAGYTSYLNECQVCTGTKEGGLDSCQGDSGGPLACPLPDGRYYLCGITSWGVGCARPDFYGVYTSVSCFSDWVKKILYQSAATRSGQ